MTKMTWSMTALGLVGALIVGVGVVMADTNSSAPSKVAQAIASQFHLNADQVQGVINDQRQQNQADRQSATKAKLDAAVKAGTITQTQETALIQKLTLVRQAKRTDRSARRDLRQWLKDNHLSLRSLLGTKSPIS